MNLSDLKPNTIRKSQKRVGRGGKRGTFSGSGSKGQKSRAGAGVKPGFRGGDNRIWQLFPKKRGASKKPGSSRPHHRHRFFQLRHSKPEVLDLNILNKLKEGQLVTPDILIQEGLVSGKDIKILSDGELNKKLDFEGLRFSNSAKQKILKAGGSIK